MSFFSLTLERFYQWRYPHEMRTKIFLIALLLPTSACGASFVQSQAQGMNTVLSTITDVVDPVYEFSIQTCNAREEAVRIRSGSTFEQDQADIALIRSNCTRIFELFEHLRQAQLRARVAVIEAEKLGTTPSLTTALEALGEFQSAWKDLNDSLHLSGMLTERDEHPPAVHTED